MTPRGSGWFTNKVSDFSGDPLTNLRRAMRYVLDHPATYRPEILRWEPAPYNPPIPLGFNVEGPPPTLTG